MLCASSVTCRALFFSSFLRHSPRHAPEEPNYTPVGHYHIPGIYIQHTAVVTVLVTKQFNSYTECTYVNYVRRANTKLRPTATEHICWELNLNLGRVRDDINVK